MTDLKSRLAQIPPERLRILAQQLKKSGPASGAIQRQPRTSNRFPAALAQERLWFLAQLSPGVPECYHDLEHRQPVPARHPDGEQDAIKTLAAEISGSWPFVACRTR